MRILAVLVFCLFTTCCLGQDGFKEMVKDTTISEAVLKKFPNVNFFENLGRLYSNGKWGFIDKQGDTILPFIYQDASDFCEGLAAVRLNSKMGFIDQKGQTVIPFIYSYAGKFWNHFAMVADEKNKYSFINIKGIMLTPFMFDNVEFFNDFGMANVKIASKWGVLDNSGKLIIPTISDYPVDFRGDKGRITIKGKETYFVDRNGQKIK